MATKKAAIGNQLRASFQSKSRYLIKFKNLNPSNNTTATVLYDNGGVLLVSKEKTVHPEMDRSKKVRKYKIRVVVTISGQEDSRKKNESKIDTL